jgi:hypothetical protein
MKPVLAAWPQPRRNVAFPIVAFVVFLVLFFAIGFATEDVFYPLLVGIPAGIAAAWLLVGWPVLALQGGKPLIEPEHKPFLFFPLAVGFTIVAYPVLGVFLTKASVPPKYLVTASLALAVLVSCGAAYYLVGFPRLVRFVRQRYAQMPPERRPFLFFPVFAVLFLILYIGLGVGTTQAMGQFQDKVVLLLNIQVLLLLPITLLVAALAAYLLVGFPRPQKPIREALPKVTGRHRPRAFLLTFLLAGVPLTVLVGYLLTTLAQSGNTSSAFLPDALVLPLALLLGYSLSLGLAVAVWGTSARWRRYPDYVPGLTPRARLGAAGAAGLAVALAVVVGSGLADVDIFWGLLVGAILGIAVGLLVSGAYRRIAARRGADTLLPDLPDRLKSVVILTTWLVLALVVFSVLTYALPGLVAWNAAIAIALGLAVSFALVEQAWIGSSLAELRAARRRRKAWQRHRKEALARAARDVDEPDGAAPRS